MTTTDATDLLPPRILAVDDERRIHASLRLRLGKDYELVFCADAREALDTLQNNRFDLCLVDIRMPRMDGFAFIEAARAHDPGLGYVVLSACDTDENLRRSIPLQIYDFIPKPLPDRDGFEARIPEWIARTRDRRREQNLARQAGTVAQDRDSARLEREVEVVASETARDALLQTASLLTTIHAHLVTATSALSSKAKADPSLASLLRNLEEARKTADATVSVAEGFFNSAYGNRDSSPAAVHAGLTHAISIACRMSRTTETNLAVDYLPVDTPFPIRRISGIDFLLMMVPALSAALTLAAANTTVRVRGEHLSRIDGITKDPRFRNFLWVNRRYATGSEAGLLLSIGANAPSLSRTAAEAWLKGEHAPLAAVTARGLVLGVQKAKGLIGLAVDSSEPFTIVLALPT
jgi:DNA-binding response OmpR family regulator